MEKKNRLTQICVENMLKRKTEIDLFVTVGSDKSDAFMALFLRLVECPLNLGFCFPIDSMVLIGAVLLCALSDGNWRNQSGPSTKDVRKNYVAFTPLFPLSLLFTFSITCAPRPADICSYVVLSQCYRTNAMQIKPASAVDSAIAALVKT